jgi:hypothetical protein
MDSTMLNDAAARSRSAADVGGESIGGTFSATEIDAFLPKSLKRLRRPPEIVNQDKDADQEYHRGNTIKIHSIWPSKSIRVTRGKVELRHRWILLRSQPFQFGAILGDDRV